jgi:hypothetical protein
MVTTYQYPNCFCLCSFCFWGKYSYNRIWNYVSRNCLLGHRKKIAKFLKRTFTCRSTFLYDPMPYNACQLDTRTAIPDHFLGWLPFESYCMLLLVESVTCLPAPLSAANIYVQTEEKNQENEKECTTACLCLGVNSVLLSRAWFNVNL